MMRELTDWFDDLARAHAGNCIVLLRQNGLETARKAGRVGVDPYGRITTPAFDPVDGQLIDILTVDPGHAAESLMLLTSMAVMLGEPPFLDGIEIYQWPMQWLHAGADGICVIDWAAARPFLTGTPPLNLIVRDREHAALIKRNLWLTWPRLILEDAA
jgi:hypothetical protein